MKPDNSMQIKIILKPGKADFFSSNLLIFYHQM